MLKSQICFPIANSILIALICTLYLTQYTNSKYVYMIWICGIYFLESNIYVITPTVAVRCFGQKKFAAYYGIIYMFTVRKYALNFKVIYS